MSASSVRRDETIPPSFDSSPVHRQRNHFQVFLELTNFGQQTSSSFFGPTLVFPSEMVHVFVGSQHPKDALERSVSSRKRQPIILPNHFDTEHVSVQIFPTVREDRGTSGGPEEYLSHACFRRSIRTEIICSARQQRLSITKPWQ